MNKQILLATTLVLSLAPAAFAATETECTTLWNKSEVAVDGKLTPKYREILADSGRTVSSDGMIEPAVFIEACKAGVLDTVKSSTTGTTAGAPVAGANSFTETQAADRITKAGFASVSGLKKDADGIWRGTAQSGGKSVTVSLDYKGNVIAN
jgi:hypothetical protein